MKKLIILILVSFVTLVSDAQITAIETTTFCFGNPEDNFIQKLSKDAKKTLSEFLTNYSVDTLSFKRIKYEEVFRKYTDKSYLSSHSYTYVQWEKDLGYSTKNEYKSVNSFSSDNFDKMILLYVTDEKTMKD